MEKQVKSKQRVSEHGEVFTNEREVKAMLDLVKDETERIESRFLEPACGNGNFLAEILKRKLAVVDRLYIKNAFEWEKYSVLAISSSYGVDILEDNVNECRERLFNIWKEAYKKATKHESDNDLKETIKHILRHNILCGDALTMKKNDGTPIIFAQWDMVLGCKFQRRDYRLDELVEGQVKNKDEEEQMSLFDWDDINDDWSYEDKKSEWVYDEETKGFIPGPVKDDYPIVDYRRLKDYE
ncbi:MAG: SAM-dependent DNA methyltransferase [Massilimicrobiota timonensis]